MQLFARAMLGVFWLAWGFPFAFLAPHRQKRPSLTAAGPSLLGLLLETIGISMAWLIRMPASAPLSLARVLPCLVLGPVAIVGGFAAVKHLGKQFRIQAGLYHDHELVRTGPYAVVRHPIYATLLGMLVCTLLILTPWQWAPVSLALYIVGTEIRVRTEDGLLESRFGEEFRRYRGKVSAYIPFVR